MSSFLPKFKPLTRTDLYIFDHNHWFSNFVTNYLKNIYQQVRKIETRIANKLQSFQTVELCLAPMAEKIISQKKHSYI